jgi:putative phosphoribosyl transferase
LAAAQLPRVTAPTLLIVGGDDDAVLEFNRQAQKQLRCTNQLKVIPDATHLFEEPGSLAAVASAARAWFSRGSIGAAG